VSKDRDWAIARAEAALGRLAIASDAFADPLIAPAFESSRAAGVFSDSRPYLQFLQARRMSYGRANARRYRWGLSHRSEPGSAAYALPPGAAPVHWRPLEVVEEPLARDATAYGQRLIEPIALAVQFGFWRRVADDRSRASDVRTDAAALLDEATPIAENDLAAWFGATDPWRDTFALWLLSAEPQAMERLRDVIFALAIRYGSLAIRQGGVVRGHRFPFKDEALVSASAQLALGLWRCGVYPSVVPSLASFVAASISESGGWADPGQEPDVLTTLAAADLLTRMDPGFDPVATINWFVSHQEPAGWWRALDPEVPWLTHAVSSWLELAGRPFPERFSWPEAPIWARDRLTGLTTMAILDELETVLAAVPALGNLPIEVAFVDLAGFGAFNSRQGQVAGDDVLALLGGSFRTLAGILPVRIGGDEFLLFGKPGWPTGAVAIALEPWRYAWADAMATRNPGELVAPRVVWSRSRSGELSHLRRTLGEAIGALKLEWPSPPPAGVIREIARTG
jgi:hypothetical protein